MVTLVILKSCCLELVEAEDDPIVVPEVLLLPPPLLPPPLLLLWNANGLDPCSLEWEFTFVGYELLLFCGVKWIGEPCIYTLLSTKS